MLVWCLFGVGAVVWCDGWWCSGVVVGESEGDVEAIRDQTLERDYTL